MNKLKYLALAAALMLSFNAQAKPMIGAAAPDFSATDINGKEVKLADLKDKVVVLEWHNPECPFVKKHYGPGNMQALQRNFTNKDVVWITVNSGAEGKQGVYADDAAAQAALKDNSFATHYIRDLSGTIGKAYAASTTPHMFIINKGLLVYMGAIDSISSADSADIAKAEKYVENALNEVLAGKEVATAITSQYGCSVKYAE